MPAEPEPISDLLARQRIVDRFLADAGENDTLMRAIGQSDSQSLSSIVQRMVHLADDVSSSADVRAQAIAGLGNIARIARALGEFQLPNGIAESRATVIRALSSSSLLLRRVAAESLVGFVPEFSEDVISVLLNGVCDCADASNTIPTGIHDSDSVVVKALLVVLDACDRGRAAQAVPQLAVLLDGKSAQQVRIAACESLRRLGRLAISAIPGLISVGLSDIDSEAQRAAVLALSTIDPDCHHVMSIAGSLEALETLIRVAQLCGSGADSVAVTLSENVAHIRNVGPLQGMVRLKFEEMIEAVFGATPDLEPGEVRQWKDSRRKNLKEWMDNRRLQSFRIQQGIYDVHMEDLQRLRASNLGSKPGRQGRSN